MEDIYNIYVLKLFSDVNHDWRFISKSSEIGFIDYDTMINKIKIIEPNGMRKYLLHAYIELILYIILKYILISYLFR